MNIYFDLDGTLINSLTRLYKLFVYLVPKCELSFNEYWELKRSGMNHFDILSKNYQYTTEEIDAFEIKWMSLIEADEWLLFDKPYAGVHSLLSDFRKDDKCFIITARQSKKNVIRQLSELGWMELFSQIMVTEHVKTKLELISETLEVDKLNWLVGDTCEDINIGKKLNFKTIAMKHGFRGKVQLSKCEPDYFAASIPDLGIILNSNR